MSWESAQSEWNEFLVKIEKVRCELQCSYSNAWFRGVSDASWNLDTSLFRYKNRIDADTQNTISRVSNKLMEVEQSLTNKTKQKKLLHKSLADFRETDKTSISDNTKFEYASICKEISDLKKQSLSFSSQLSVLKSIHYGEREAFTEFSFRLGRTTQCSWEILAEMQHYRTPTRLLDWSEVLAVAIYFALESYISELKKIWEPNDGEGLRESSKGGLPFVIPPGLSTPRLWILNPYGLSRKARGENALLDPTKERRYDYFESFFLRHDWPFALPTPVYTPWRNPRIIAQRAMFTIQGTNTEPMNKLLKTKDGILSYVDFTPGAAVYGVKHLMNFIGLNSYSIFQDIDSLSDDIRRNFITPN